MEIVIPKNITPKEFFEDFLPKEYQKLDSTLKLPLNFTVGSEVTGKGGGDWGIDYDNGEIDVYRGTPDEPLFTVSVDIKEWQRAIDNNLTSVFFTAAELDNNMVKLLNQKKIERLKQEHGKINITIDSVEYLGEVFDFNFTILIGEPLDVDPSLSIKILQEDFNKIKENPQNLYKLISSNTLNTSGDFRYLMKLATIIFF
jgi:hypothetical protein